MSSIISHKGLTVTNPLVLYRALVASQKLEADPAQHLLAIHLQKLYFRLIDYKPIVDYHQRLEHVGKVLEKKDANLRSGSSRPKLFSAFLSQPPKNDLSLIKVLSSHEAALSIDSPKGLLLHGGVGTGKSMLVDILAASLPNKYKQRSHYSTFVLDLFARLEVIRRSPSEAEEEYSLLRLARDFSISSPVLFVDEFQIPDRASSKILTNFFLPFFQLGGVLIATSNRMPEELSKAAGIQYTSPPFSSEPSRPSLPPRRVEGLDAGQAEFASFLDVLKARCDIWNMDGKRDYRRHESPSDSSGLEALQPGNSGFEFEQSLPMSDLQVAPIHYHTSPTPSLAFLTKVSALHTTPLEPYTLTVYARPISLPTTHPSGLLLTSFAALCSTPLGPADYTSLAATFHTIFITDVPPLTVSRKDQARRFISLLDALYEARCRLSVHAAVPLDELFFPPADSTIGEGHDPILAETREEIAADLGDKPFRPHVFRRTAFGDEDEDSDFRLESGGAGEQQPFTGVDERFAAERAVSRLWEMCGNRWWEDRSGPVEEWWRPVEAGKRAWEREIVSGGGAEFERVDARDERDQPRFSEAHFWGMAKWGKRAGAWGKGAG